MTRPPGWPFDFLPELAARYDDAVQSLYATLGQKGDHFDIAVCAAIKESERARTHNWQEEQARRKDLEDLVDSSIGAHKAARKFADHFEKWDELTATLRLTTAAKSTGVSIFAKNGEPGHLALSLLLRELAEQSLRFIRGNQEGYDTFGPLRRKVGDTIRGTWPSAAVATTVSLANLFYLMCQPDLKEKLNSPNTVSLLNYPDFSKVLDGKKTVTLQAPSVRTYGAVIDKGACWEAATEFSRAAFPNESSDNLASTAQRWLLNHKGEIAWIGWPRRRPDNKPE